MIVGGEFFTSKHRWTNKEEKRKERKGKRGGGGGRDGAGEGRGRGDGRKKGEEKAGVTWAGNQRKARVVGQKASIKRKITWASVDEAGAWLLLLFSNPTMRSVL